MGAALDMFGHRAADPDPWRRTLILRSPTTAFFLCFIINIYGDVGAEKHFKSYEKIAWIAPFL